MPWKGAAYFKTPHKETVVTELTAAVLAGGLGTRLRSEVNDRPKVLAPVSDRPFLTYLLDMLYAASVRRVVLLTGYQGHLVQRELGEEYLGMKLAYSTEPSPQGTAGALRAALPHFDGSTVLLLNGDSYCGINLSAFALFHRRRRADASLVLTRVADASRYGRVETTTAGRIRAFAEKESACGSGWINAGVYLLERSLIEQIPTGKPVSLEREMLPRWIESKAVFGCRRVRPFLDIGTPESYSAAPAFMRKIRKASHSKAAQKLWQGS
jgi:D-glycero-alpha-D-manno-heptose 1-phosphate guanylyltransferase